MEYLSRSAALPILGIACRERAKMHPFLSNWIITRLAKDTLLVVSLYVDVTRISGTFTFRTGLIIFASSNESNVLHVCVDSRRTGSNNVRYVCYDLRYLVCLISLDEIIRFLRTSTLSRLRCVQVSRKVKCNPISEVRLQKGRRDALSTILEFVSDGKFVSPVSCDFALVKLEFRTWYFSTNVSKIRNSDKLFVNDDYL